MSGHSKWAGIKHKKAAADAKRERVREAVARHHRCCQEGEGTQPQCLACQAIQR